MFFMILAFGLCLRLITTFYFSSSFYRVYFYVNDSDKQNIFDRIKTTN